MQQSGKAFEGLISVSPPRETGDTETSKRSLQNTFVVAIADVDMILQHVAMRDCAMIETPTEDSGATLIATAQIEGPEARGQARFWRLADGWLALTINDYWVAPGPDPRIYLTDREDDMLDLSTAVSLGRAPTDTNIYRRVLEKVDSLQGLQTLLVHCTRFSVFFGSGRIKPVE